MKLSRELLAIPLFGFSQDLFLHEILVRSTISIEVIIQNQRHL